MCRPVIKVDMRNKLIAVVVRLVYTHSIDERCSLHIGIICAINVFSLIKDSTHDER